MKNKTIRKAINLAVKEGVQITFTTVKKRLANKSLFSDFEIKEEIAFYKSEIKTQNKIKKEKNQKPVKQITISIEWKKSHIWNFNPHAAATIQYKDGTYNYLRATCSGCGYDKESTVIADILNRCLKYKLWNIKPSVIKSWKEAGDSMSTWKKRNIIPYGINLYNPEIYRSFEGGVGVSCYLRDNGIIGFLGGKMINTNTGKLFDCYTITFK
jgi:hypothetical protein